MDFTQQLQACVTQANQALSRFIAPLPFQNTPVVEAMQYGALLGGKRLRPFLVYATGQMFGVSTATLDAPAAAVECIHAYSLIHDDLPAMDDDDLRRGLPTCHIKFGEATQSWRETRCKRWRLPLSATRRCRKSPIAIVSR